MLAVDTNVVVRYLAEDDAAQSRVVKRLIDENDIWLLQTVMLETEWVLRSLYAFDRDRVHAGLTAFAGLRNVSLEQPERVAAALEWSGQGMDFADALHLAACPEGVAIATFDRQLVAAARKAKAGKVRAL